MSTLAEAGLPYGDSPAHLPCRVSSNLNPGSETKRFCWCTCFSWARLHSRIVSWHICFPFLNQTTTVSSLHSPETFNLCNTLLSREHKIFVDDQSMDSHFNSPASYHQASLSCLVSALDGQQLAKIYKVFTLEQKMSAWAQSTNKQGRHRSLNKRWGLLWETVPWANLDSCFIPNMCFTDITIAF